MRRKKKGFGRITVLLGLLLGTAVMGRSYAAWTKTQSIEMYLNTDSFVMVFGQGEGYKTELIRGEESMELETGISPIFDEDKKTAILNMDSAVLSELLDGESLLKISMPIENGREGYHAGVLEYDPDFEEEGERFSMSAEEIFLSFSGRVYKYPEAEAVFREDLELELFRSVRREDGRLFCILYLRPTEESRNLLAGFPKTIELEKEDLEAMEEGALKAEQDGVIVKYQGELVFRLDQKEAGQENRR